MVKEDTIMSELRRTDAHLWNRKDFNLFLLKGVCLLHLSSENIFHVLRSI